MPRVKTLSLNEIADIVNENNDILGGEITILPPDTIQSDEDSGDEEEPNLNNLSRNQLLSEAEACITRIIEGELVTEVITADDTAENVESTDVTNRKKKKIRNWVEKDISPSFEKEFDLPQWLQDSDGDPVALFEMFYDYIVVNMICEYSNLYAFQQGEPNLNLKPEEVRLFLAVLLLSGYCQVPRLRMYWEQSPDCNNKAISDSISRNRFTQIMRYFHVCDNNNLAENDRYAKVLPLWKKMNERWLKHFPNEMNLCVDESMIPYYGRHGGKQHMHGKPIRFGYKAWCLCSRLGYLVQGELYQGAKTGNTHPEVGVSGSVVLNLLANLPKKEYTVYFDNFFTSICLLEKLKESGLHGTGTIRANRVEGAPLTEPKYMKNTDRGTFEQVTDQTSNITLVRYNDNNIVTVASTKTGTHPIGKVKRFSQATKKYVSIDQPSCIVLYNTYMGGVDRMDENVAKMRVNIRGKKWYWQLVSFPLNVSVNNAWQLHRWAVRDKHQLDLLNFTRQICLTYLQRFGQRNNLGRPPHCVRAVDKRVTDQVRFDQVQHLIVKSEKQSRCGLCKKNARMMCVKCKIALHGHCFAQFHTA